MIIQFDLYRSVADYCPDQFKAMIKNRDDECSDCPYYLKNDLEGYPVRGCRKGINLNWLINNECDERKELQTTIFEVM